MFSSQLLKINPRSLLFFAIYGLLGVSLNYASYFYALRWTNVATAVILLYTYPAFITILARFIFNERIDLSKALALLLTLGGIFLVAQGYDFHSLKLNLSGILFGLGAGMTAALYSLFGKRAVQAYDSWTTALYSFGFGALFLLLYWGPQNLLTVSYTWKMWGALFYLALFPTLLAYSLYLKALHHLEASKAGITATLEPVLAALMAYILLGESLELLQIIGGALVLGGVTLLRPS